MSNSKTILGDGLEPPDPPPPKKHKTHKKTTNNCLSRPPASLLLLAISKHIKRAIDQVGGRLGFGLGVFGFYSKVWPNNNGDCCVHAQTPHALQTHAFEKCIGFFVFNDDLDGLRSIFDTKFPKRF